MDFDAKKPTHFVALLLLFGTVALFIGFPLISLFYSMQIPSLYDDAMAPLQRYSIELSLLFMQLLFVFVGLIVVPLLWYTLVNKISLKEVFTRVKLHRTGLDIALLWGFVIVLLSFAMSVIIGLIIMYLTRVDPKSLSNIPDLQLLFSIPSLYLLVTLQPFCEEFFFRGFLFEKISKVGGVTLAVISTSLLFGISHLSYTYAYAAVIAIILGVLLALVVLKTRNLFSAIFAHTLINIISLTAFLFGVSFLK